MRGRLREADVEAVALGGGVFAGEGEEPGGCAGGDVGDVGVLGGERDGWVEVVGEFLVPDVVLGCEAGGGGEVAIEDIVVFDWRLGGHGGGVLCLGRPIARYLGGWWIVVLYDGCRGWIMLTSCQKACLDRKRVLERGGIQEEERTKVSERFEGNRVRGSE